VFLYLSRILALTGPDWPLGYRALTSGVGPNRDQAGPNRRLGVAVAAQRSAPTNGAGHLSDLEENGPRL